MLASQLRTFSTWLAGLKFAIAPERGDLCGTAIVLAIARILSRRRRSCSRGHVYGEQPHCNLPDEVASRRGSLLRLMLGKCRSYGVGG